MDGSGDAAREFVAGAGSVLHVMRLIVGEEGEARDVGLLELFAEPHEPRREQVAEARSRPARRAREGAGPRRTVGTGGLQPQPCSARAAMRPQQTGVLREHDGRAGAMFCDTKQGGHALVGALTGLSVFLSRATRPEDDRLPCYFGHTWRPSAKPV